jgi:exonuclease VII small subunit
MIEKMWTILTTFTEEAQQAALSKCKELGLDQNRGVASLDESYINLNSACNILKDAIETKKLIQLPITIQKDLIAALEMIATRQTGLINGSDEVVNLADAIEKLNTYIWQYGLHNLSDQVLGYQAKLNQLKAMELAATGATRQLQEGIQVKDQLQQILGNATQQSQTLQTHVDDANTSLTATNEALAQAEEASRKATESLTAVQQTVTTSTQLLATSTKSNDEILSFEAHINELVSGFTTLKGDLEINKTQQQDLFAQFEAHRNKINDLLDDANRTGMAASFTNRRRWLIAPMLSWIAVFGGSIYGLFQMGATYLAPILASGNWEQLPARLALTAPLIWLGWFSAKQYGYTSRLREDYAYKEASAKSFEGYKREAGQVDPSMLKNLLDTAIKNLGDNPIRI